MKFLHNDWCVLNRSAGFGFRFCSLFVVLIMIDRNRKPSLVSCVEVHGSRVQSSRVM